MSSFSKLLRKVRGCEACEDLPLGPGPLLQADPAAKILIAGQAPGRKTHEKGRPFDDVSGERLRDWMGVSCEEFYAPKNFAIIPMGFCFPGTGRSGDLPPRTECAELWREKLLSELQNVELTIILGRYALNYHLPKEKGKSLTNIVSNWREYLPSCLPLPHPSPRNSLWLRKNKWFEKDVIPALRGRISELIE